MTDAGLPIEARGINVAVVREVNENWEFLILRRSDQSTYHDYWGLLSGTRNADETIEQLALREIIEETGLVPQSLWASEYMIQFFEPTAGAVWVLPVLVAIFAESAKIRLSPENEEFQWLAAENAQKLVSWKNLKRVIADISEDLTNFPPANWVQLRT